MTERPSFVVEDQSEVIAFLTGRLAPARRIDTHGAVVFLSGERAYKLKRAVKFPYMDFSTEARRAAMCAAEIDINRQLAPEIYLGVAPIRRGEGGRLTDFVMNDKCAASSGRYLENMAAVLEVSLSELSSYSEEPIPLDATCGIFGESELIGQILRGHPLSRLCAGVNLTLVKRVLPMLKRFPSPTLVITGGVALNGAMVELLTASCGMEVVVPEHPQHNGAIGCATL